ncbi:MAG: hypothetical protein V8Q30_07500 [Acutalibacteraceae bacterium]
MRSDETTPGPDAGTQSAGRLYHRTVLRAGGTGNSSSQSSSLPEEEPENSSESVSEPQSSTAQNSSAVSQPAVTLAWWQQELSNEKLIATPDPVLGFAPCGTPEGSYWIYDDTRKVSWLGNGLFARSSDTAETARWR